MLQAQQAESGDSSREQLGSGVENLMQDEAAIDNERKDSGDDNVLAANQNEQEIQIPSQQIEYTFAAPPRAPRQAQKSRHRIKTYRDINEVLDSMFPDAFSEYGLNRDRFTEYYSQQLRVNHAFDREDGHFILREFDHKKGVWLNGYQTIFPRPDSDMLWCRCDQFVFDSKLFASTTTFCFVAKIQELPEMRSRPVCADRPAGERAAAPPYAQDVPR